MMTNMTNMIIAMTIVANCDNNEYHDDNDDNDDKHDDDDDAPVSLFLLLLTFPYGFPGKTKHENDLHLMMMMLRRTVIVKRSRRGEGVPGTFTVQ